MTRDTGGPAFPLSGRELPNGEYQYPEYGMTLRDYMAAAALVAIKPMYGEHAKSCPRSVAEFSYEIADAMLAERLKPTTGEENAVK